MIKSLQNPLSLAGRLLFALLFLPAGIRGAGAWSVDALRKA